MLLAVWYSNNVKVLETYFYVIGTKKAKIRNLIYLFYLNPAKISLRWVEREGLEYSPKGMSRERTGEKGEEV